MVQNRFLALLFVFTSSFSYGLENVSYLSLSKDSGFLHDSMADISLVQLENCEKDLNFEEIVNFFGCKTNAGAHLLYQLLGMPVASKDIDTVVKSRQDLIKTLSTDKAFKIAVQELVSQACKAEAPLQEMFLTETKASYYPPLFGPELIKANRKKSRLIVFWDRLSQTYLGRLTQLGLKATGFAGAVAGMSIQVKECRKAWQGFRTKLGLHMDVSTDIQAVSHAASSAASSGVTAAFQAYMFYQDYVQLRIKRNYLHHLHLLIEITEKFEKLCVNKGLTQQFALSSLIKDPKIKKLIANLKHARYQADSLVVFDIAAVDILLAEVYQNSEALSGLFACIGELDIYNALAEKVIKQDKQMPWCFTQFVNNDLPVVKSEHYWNILVQKPKVHSVCLDTNIVLTGSNAGGKSTTIRAILQNLLLSHIFGIAAASSFVCTPFDVMHSFLNISDDQLKGESLFVSEVNRAKFIKNTIAQLNKDQRYFFALDELFTGTGAAGGEECAYRFIQSIAATKNTRFIYATHFARLTELEKQGYGCTNYKVGEPIILNDGSLEYPFTLDIGYGESKVAVHIAEQEGLFN